MTRIAYLVSRYPAVSHSFIQREVLALRGLGVEVETFSLRRATDDEAITPLDHAERDKTYALQPVSPLRFVADQVATLLRAPARYLATLGFAIGRGAGLRGRLWQVFYFAKAVLLVAELRRRNLWRLHVHFANAGADVALMAGRLADELAWSLTLHGPAEFFDVTGNRLATKLEAPVWIACVSDWVRSQAMSLMRPELWDRLRVIRLGVDTGEWSPQPRKPDGPTQILNVGRLDPVKGQAVLIEAVAQIPEVRCTIVGGGGERTRLEALIREHGVADRVELTGAVGQDRIRALYAQADVFCLPSFRESLPVVLMEALAMEIPVVATRIMGVPELVEDGVSGLLVSPGRADELADALLLLTTDAQLRERFGKAGRERVQHDYELARLARELRDAFAAPATAADSANR